MAPTSLQDLKLNEAIEAKLNNKTKPVGSLGQIEFLAQQISRVQQTLCPELKNPQLVVFAGDHGLTRHAVSAYPREVTWQMVENFLSGGAAVSVLARQHQLKLSVVDAGIDHDFAPHPALLDYKIARGTADPLLGPAMTETQCQQAIRNGREVIQQLPGNVVLLGEMGIGNTSSASLMVARLTAQPLADCVGRGTGLDDSGMARKLSVLQQIEARHPDAQDPLAVLAAFGGFELAMLVGAALECAAQRRLCVVDGFIVSAAILVAHQLNPLLSEFCVYAHCSGENGHRQLLRHLNARPLLDLGLRLGEGSGAALAWPLVVSAVQLLNEMASFEQARVAKRIVLEN